MHLDTLLVSRVRRKGIISDGKMETMRLSLSFNRYKPGATIVIGTKMKVLSSQRLSRKLSTLRHGERERNNNIYFVDECGLLQLETVDGSFWLEK